MPIRHAALAALFVAFATAANADGPPDTKQLLADERRAMRLLDGFVGRWRGPATTVLPDGRTLQLTQTERFGPFLDGSVRVVEGRGYAVGGNDGDGALLFNAFGVVSYDPQASAYRFRAYAQGHAADFDLEVAEGRFVWRYVAGPATIRYTATVEHGVWHEIGERLVDGRPPQVIHEMSLTRIGDTDWPAAGAVPPR